MASLADVDYDQIYLGPWINRSKGLIAGANITTSSRNGAVLVAFLALFIQFSGQHLWGIICFVWYHYRARTQLKCALQHQQDVLLRNNSGPAQTLWDYLHIAWSWRKAAPKWYTHAVYPLTIPFLAMNTILIFGLISSTIVSSSNIEVLVRGNKCGLWVFPSVHDLQEIQNQYFLGNSRYIRRVTEFSRMYSRTCYNRTSHRQDSNCRAFTTPSIGYKTTTNASCPFARETCLNPDGGGLQLDTGMMDSNNIFGINTASDNIETRKLTSCAILNPDQFTTTGHQYSREFPFANQSVHNFTRYHYGFQWGYDDDYIFEVDQYHAETTSRYQVGAQTWFVSKPYPPYFDQNQFEPREEFNRSDADITFMFLQLNGVSFTEPSDDPWFSAHQPYIQPIQGNGTYYRADHLANVLGCVEQYQFCDSRRKDKCTALTGIQPAVHEAKEKLGLSPIQSATVDIFFNLVYSLSAFIQIPVYQGTNFLAEEGQMQIWQLPLAANQWVLELQDMHNTVLASWQRDVVDYARGPGTPDAQQFIVAPTDPAARALCGMIRARTDGRYSNVNIYGLAIVLGFGGLCILVNFLLPSFTTWLHGRRGASDSVYDRAWTKDSLLQLQKTVFESQGQGHWKYTTGSVPITKKGDLIAKDPGRERRLLYRRFAALTSEAATLAGSTDEEKEGRSLKDVSKPVSRDAEKRSLAESAETSWLADSPSEPPTVIEMKMVKGKFVSSSREVLPRERS